MGKVLYGIICFYFLSGLTANAENTSTYLSLDNHLDPNAVGAAIEISDSECGILSTISFAVGNEVMNGSGAIGSFLMRHPGLGANILAGNQDQRDDIITEAGKIDPSAELVQFGISSENENVQLFWVTSSENNNLKFEIELSTDGNQWIKRGEIAGAGNSNTYNKYRFTDKNALQLESSTLYYRLHQVSFDGQSTYSSIESIETGKKPVIIGNAWHNRISDEYNLRFEAKEGGQAQLTLMDINGRVLSNQTESISPGYNALNIPLNPYNHNILILCLKTGDQVFKYKILKR